MNLHSSRESAAYAYQIIEPDFSVWEVGHGAPGLRQTTLRAMQRAGSIVERVEYTFDPACGLRERGMLLAFTMPATAHSTALFTHATVSHPEERRLMLDAITCPAHAARMRHTLANEVEDGKDDGLYVIPCGTGELGFTTALYAASACANAFVYRIAPERAQWAAQRVPVAFWQELGGMWSEAACAAEERFSAQQMARHVVLTGHAAPDSLTLNTLAARDAIYGLAVAE